MTVTDGQQGVGTGRRRGLRWTPVRGDGGLLLLAGALVKADAAGDQDRVYLAVNGAVRRGPIHVVHDLPHLVVESLLGIDDGLWAELEAAQHAAARAVTARAAKRQKQGRIVSGAPQGEALSQWLTTGHRRAKVLAGHRRRRGVAAPMGGATQGQDASAELAAAAGGAGQRHLISDEVL